MDGNNLGFSTCLTQCTFNLHCQMWEVNEAMCGIDDHSVMSHEMQYYDRSCQILHHNKIFCKNVIPMSNLSVVVAVGFSNWPFAT